MKKDYRTKPRRLMRYKAWIQTEPGADARACHLADISESGARLLIDDAQSMPNEIRLLVAERSAGRACRVIWRSEGEIGLRFEEAATAGNARRKP